MQINVFKLGRAYKALLDELRLGGTVFLMNPIDPESLIYRFAKQLEFGSATMQVASEAVRIVQRMNRDWMTTGRRPAGICGAALILAARMNNFRRTVREVVYVVKVTEITINQRLNEFSSTESGDLTVDQFRSVHLENAHDPPSFTQAREGKGKYRKRKAPETAAEIEGNQNSTETSQPPEKKKRVDADGFVIPDPPIDPALLNNKPSATPVDETAPEEGQNGMPTPESSVSEDGTKPKRGRPKRTAPAPPTAEELASEEALENEMNELLSKGSDMVESAIAPSQAPVRKPVPESEEIDAAEFEDDPEVANCLLSPAEVEIKERIWVHENKDYLRTQQAKALKLALSQASAPGVPAKPRKRRKGRLGDVTYLEGEEGEDGRSSRASTPAEATRRMLEKRGFSRKINYRLLESLYGEEGAQEAAKAKAESASRSSRSQSIASRRSLSVEPTPPGPTTTKPAVPSTATAAARDTSDAPKEEILGPVPESDRPNGDKPSAYPDEEEGDDLDDLDDEDDAGDDYDEGDDPDGIEAAFAGRYSYADDDYYDEGSDYD